MSMSTNDYYRYREMVQEIVKYGDKDTLIDLYRRILARTGDRKALRDLDSYNYRWSIDLDSL